MAEADGVDVDVGEAAERFTGQRSVMVERPEYDLALVLGGDVTGEQDGLVREVQGDAAVGVAGSRQDAGVDRVEDLVVVELAVDTRRRGVGDGAGDMGVELLLGVGEGGKRVVAVPRMIGASPRCAQIRTFGQVASSAASRRGRDASASIRRGSATPGPDPNHATPR